MDLESVFQAAFANVVASGQIEAERKAQQK